MAPSTSRSSNSSPRVPAESSRTPSRENRPPLTNLPNLPNLNPQPSAYISPYAPITTRPQQSASQPTLPARSGINSSLGETHSVDFQTSSAAVSTYSSSSQHSLYSSPGPRQYAVLTPGMMSDPQSISQKEKEQLIQALRTHRVNTLTELRRIERIFASLNAPEVTEPMTTGWAHYVNSNNLLNELRGITKNYPFSSECIDEAKGKVVEDPASTRSWNYCWLVLTKIRDQGLVAKHARLQAVKPTMWGGRTPTAAGIEKLTTACTTEWTRALDQMLRNWSTPPSTTGR